MKFINKNTGESISQETWLQLSELGKSNFIQQSETTVQNITNNTTNVSNKTSDVLGIGEVATVAVALPLVIVGGIFGLFD